MEELQELERMASDDFLVEGAFAAFVQQHFEARGDKLPSDCTISTYGDSYWGVIEVREGLPMQLSLTAKNSCANPSPHEFAGYLVRKRPDGYEAFAQYGNSRASHKQFGERVNKLDTILLELSGHFRDARVLHVEPKDREDGLIRTLLLEYDGRTPTRVDLAMASLRGLVSRWFKRA